MNEKNNLKNGCKLTTIILKNKEINQYFESKGRKINIINFTTIQSAV